MQHHTIDILEIIILELGELSKKNVHDAPYVLYWLIILYSTRIAKQSYIKHKRFQRHSQLMML